MTMPKSLEPGEHLVTIRGIPIRYRIAGAGPVLVVQSPGWGVGAALYEATFAALASRFTLITYDPRGSGGSGAPTSPDDLHVGEFVEDLEALRAHLGLDRFALLGHSHGGFLAVHYALRHPERVTHLVALDAQLVGVVRHPSERDAQADTPELAAALDHLDAAGGFGAIFDMTTDAEVTAFMRRAIPVYFKDVRHAAALEALLAARELPLRTMQAVSASDGAFPLGEGLRTLRVPTLVVNGRYDLLCPPSGGRTLAETIPGARRVVFEESAHFPWLEEPARFFDEVRAFLSAPLPRAP